jgi:choloylglycine hydrolase
MKQKTIFILLISTFVALPLLTSSLFGFPVAQLITSDGRVLEGHGVIPDIIVSLNREQLLQGIDDQLQAGIDYINKATRSTFIQIGVTEIVGNQIKQSCSANDISGGEIPSHCTVFTVSKGDQVFFGGNDDYINPDSYYWVDPGIGKDYGAIWIGTRDNVQQGVNEKGLAYDANGLPRIDVNPHREREPVPGDYTIYPIRILHECATVEEVIHWVNTHQWHSYMHDQMQFADATGDAVILSAGADGEIVITRKPPGDGFLVSTNFNVANPSNGDYPCQRYQTATKLLDQLVSQSGELTLQDAINVLDAVHIEGNSSWTIESMVADLPNGMVYLYYFYQYDKPVVLNVAEEIAHPRADGTLSRLFPEEVQQEAARRYQRIQEQRNNNETLGKVWLGLVLISLTVLLVGSVKRPKELIFWVPVVVILGPVGLLIWLAAGRTRRIGNWRKVLVEAVGDVIPTVVAFLTVTVALVLNMGASDLVLILLFFGAPFVISWLLFQGPLLAFATHKGYWRTLLLRLPHTWVTANLGIAVLFPIALPLVNRSIQIPLGIWTVVFWWGLIALCALAAMLLLLLYEAWGAHRSYQAWSILAWMEGEVTSAPWKNIWWWILLSYVILLGGLVLYIFIQ